MSRQDERIHTLYCAAMDALKESEDAALRHDLRAACWLLLELCDYVAAILDLTGAW